MVKKIFKIITDHSQITLIVTILFIIFVIPYFANSPSIHLFNIGVFTLLLISAVLTFNKSGKKLAMFGNMGYLIIILVFLAELTTNLYIELASKIFFILFLIYVAINLLLVVIKAKEVDSVVLSSAVAVYLLFGFCGALITGVVLFFEPNAFSIEASDPSIFHQCLYFSFVTITTTGYGDILPLKPIAKTLAIFLALFGQIYLTIIIGILIGKYLSRTK